MQKINSKIDFYINSKVFLSIILLCLAIINTTYSQNYNIENFQNKNYKDFKIGTRGRFSTASEIYTFDTLISQFKTPYLQRLTDTTSIFLDKAYTINNYSETEYVIDFDYKIFEDTRFFVNLPITFVSLEQNYKLDSIVIIDNFRFLRTIDLSPDSNFNETFLNHISFGLRQYLKNTDNNYIYLFGEYKLALNKVENINNNPNFPLIAPLSNELSIGTGIGYKYNKTFFEGNFIYNLRDKEYLDRIFVNTRFSYQNFEESAIYATYDIVSSIGLNDATFKQNDFIKYMTPRQISLGYETQALGLGFWFELKKKILFDVNYKIMLFGTNQWKTNTVNVNIQYKF